MTSRRRISACSLFSSARAVKVAASLGLCVVVKWSASVQSSSLPSSSDRIEVQLHAWHERLWVRVSAQIYNDRADILRLAEAVARRLQ